MLYFNFNNSKYTDQYGAEVDDIPEAPCCVYYDNLRQTVYYLNRKYHREDGPAQINYAGVEVWFLNGKRHRDNGPAVIWPTGHKAWYVNDKLHRLDGPAIEFSNGNKKWYIDNQFITNVSQEYFKRLMKLKAFW